MPKISIYLSAAFMIVFLVIGISIGYYLTPEYRLAMYDKNSMDLGTADKWLDLRYINAMIAHHRGAMLVAEQALKSERPEVANLAKAIITDEPKAIAELYSWKKSWYGDTRSVPDPIVPRLGAYDSTFDLRFLNAVIAHHQTGVLMTKEVRLKSTRSEILNNANAVEEFLTGGITMLSDWRKAWYKL